jgi:chemotaxis protein CheD
MEENIDVQTGEVKVSKKELASNAIGSCVAVIAYDSKKRIGGIAHIMLPGRASDNYKSDKTKYAANAIDELIKEMVGAGANKSDIEACIVGGGNVLKRKEDSVPANNIKSVIELLEKNNIKIRAEAIGSTERRTVHLDVEKGVIKYTEGDGAQEILWRFE